jgi:CDP-diacylglycerol--glycerol-3-phosphate 3-phosphatidyltransferase
MSSHLSVSIAFAIYLFILVHRADGYVGRYRVSFPAKITTRNALMKKSVDSRLYMAASSDAAPEPSNADSNDDTNDASPAVDQSMPEISSFKQNIPNILTVSRVFMIPFFILAHVLGQKSIATLIFVVASITDFLDGYLARKYKVSSPFGAFLDPVADKLMVTTALVMLVSLVPAWWFALPVALILCREIAVSALREWMAERQQRASVQVGNLGKWKTATQMVSVVLLLEAAPNGALAGATESAKVFDLLQVLGMRRSVVFFLGIMTLNASAVLTLVSGWQYFTAAWPSLMGKTDKQ